MSRSETEQEITLGENSRITLGLLVILGAVIVYITLIDFNGRANSKSIDNLQKDSEAIQDIKINLVVIKSEMRNLTEEVKRNRIQGGKKR